MENKIVLFVASFFYLKIGELITYTEKVLYYKLYEKYIFFCNILCKTRIYV